MKNLLFFLLLLTCQVAFAQSRTIQSDTLSENEYVVFSTKEGSISGFFYFENGKTEEIFIANTIGKIPKSLALSSPEMAILTLKVMNYMDKKGYKPISSQSALLQRLTTDTHLTSYHEVMFIFSHKRTR